MKPSIFKYADAAFLRKMFALTTIEQMASAMITASLALAGKNLASPDRFLIFVIGFFVLSQLPFLVQVFIRRVETRGFLEMYFRFLDERLLRRSGRPAVWALPAQREKYLTAIGPEAEGYLTSVTFTWFDSYSYLLSIILNTVALSIVIDADYGWIFALSMLVSYVVYRAQEKSLHQVVEQEQMLRLDFSAYVLRAWDNIFLKNTSVRDKYVDGLQKRFTQTRAATGRSAFASALTVFWVGLASTLPVFALNIYLAIYHRESPGLVAAMMITLPRQLQILGMFRALFVQMTNLKMFMVRFRAACDASSLEEADLRARIDFHKLRVDGALVAGLEEVITRVTTQKSGRVHISGANGAGKSSLLLLLNARLENSFYLPAAPQLEIGGPNEGSTGQRLLKHIEFIKDQGVDVLLLDEWDANLDPTNRAAISQELDRLAQSSLLLEIRH